MNVLLTGGSRGIGGAIAACYTRNGWGVIAPSREQMDLSKVGAALDYVKSIAVPVHAIISCAGLNDEDDWNGMHTVNFAEPVSLISYLMNTHRELRWVVAISSCHSILGRAGRAGYASSKAAMDAVIRCLAAEWAPHRVLLNSVVPGYINTDMTKSRLSKEEVGQIVNQIPVGNLGEPVDVAELVYFLASEKNQYITGQQIVVDGGFSTCRL